MILYIVRHGQSHDDANGLHQSESSPLTSLGEKQSNLIAQRVSKLNFDFLLSSPILRTKQTAEAISKVSGIKIEYSELVKEKKDPSEIIGKPVNDPKVREIKKQILDRISEEGWKYSDEENVFELRKRAGEALEYLQGLSHNAVVLVTHGAFTKMLLDLMAFGEKFDPEIYIKLRNFMWDRNTGLTVCEYDGKRWKMTSWNDVAHLAD